MADTAVSREYRTNEPGVQGGAVEVRFGLTGSDSGLRGTVRQEDLNLSEQALRHLAETDPAILMQRMSSMDPPDLANAAEILGTFSTPSVQVAERLCPIAKFGAEPYVRERAIYGLAHQKASFVPSVLRFLSEHDASSTVREAASEALALIEDP